MKTNEVSSSGVPLRWLRSAFVACILVSFLMISTLLYAPSAHAGTNGQIIQVTCQQANTVSVIGVNQNGQEVMQTFSPDSGGGSTFTTQGYWWVGSIDVIWYGSNGQGGEYYDTVPQQQDGDIYAVNCHNPLNGGANADPLNCDPGISPSPGMVVTCLGEAPIPPPGGCLNAPCLPKLTSGYIDTTTNSFYCIIASYGGQKGTGWLGAAVFTNWGGSTSILSYLWGLDYTDANGTPIYSLSSGGDKPVILLDSRGVTFTCNKPAS